MYRTLYNQTNRFQKPKDDTCFIYILQLLSSHVIHIHVKISVVFNHSNQQNVFIKHSNTCVI